jgi:hypothetical protein
LYKYVNHILLQMNSQSTKGKRKGSSSILVTSTTTNAVLPNGKPLGTYIIQSYDVNGSSKKSRRN